MNNTGVLMETNTILAVGIALGAAAGLIILILAIRGVQSGKKMEGVTGLKDLSDRHHNRTSGRSIPEVGPPPGKPRVSYGVTVNYAEDRPWHVRGWVEDPVPSRTVRVPDPTDPPIRAEKPKRKYKPRVDKKRSKLD